MNKDLNEICKEIVEFSDVRDWKQFHNPKDLAISLSIEASELLECFQWKITMKLINRADAIAYHGTKCKICGFNFEKVYGHRGKGYIEIYHINPLSNVGEEVKIDPKEDLIPVCANCHRMIHRRKDNILSIEDMADLIK